MKFVVNTIYAVLTWTAAFTIGAEIGWNWLAWSLAVMAALQSFAIVYEAIREL